MGLTLHGVKPYQQNTLHHSMKTLATIDPKITQLLADAVQVIEDSIAIKVVVVGAFVGFALIAWLISRKI